MINVTKEKLQKLDKAKSRSKKHLKSSEERPRMLVFRSNKYLYVQVIDDVNHKILCTASSISKDLKGQKLTSNIKSAGIIGKEVAKKLKDLKVEKVVFDRNGYKYHGKIKALADSCREAGINF